MGGIHLSAEMIYLLNFRANESNLACRFYFRTVTGVNSGVICAVFSLKDTYTGGTGQDWEVALSFGKINFKVYCKPLPEKCRICKMDFSLLKFGQVHCQTPGSREKC